MTRTKYLDTRTWGATPGAGALFLAHLVEKKPEVNDVIDLVDDRVR